MKTTTNPHYEGYFLYGDGKPHCWSGPVTPGRAAEGDGAAHHGAQARLGHGRVVAPLSGVAVGGTAAACRAAHVVARRAHARERLRFSHTHPASSASHTTVRSVMARTLSIATAPPVV